VGAGRFRASILRRNAVRLFYKAERMVNRQRNASEISLLPKRLRRLASSTGKPGGLSTLSVVVCAALFTTDALALQSYPHKPIRIIVAAAAGNASDISARNLAHELGLQLGQQVVVDNRPGASGIIGFEMMARAAPDGYTFGYIPYIFATNPSMHSKLPYDSTRDFQPIILFSSSPSLLVVTPSLPIHSVKDLIEHARAKPGSLSFGSVGIGSSLHLSIELLKIVTDTNIVHVSYKGSQQAITDVIGGEIHMVCDTIPSVLPHVKSGRVRALGITSSKRSTLVPEVPTIDEAGIPGYELTTWGGYASPARTPRNLVWRLNAEINKALSSPSVSKAIAARGSTPIGGTPEQFTEHLRMEIEKWGKVIKAAGIKPQ
jgi:tripartite-type tricarboxylate transporter receptor subunit TctC